MSVVDFVIPKTDRHPDGNCPTCNRSGHVMNIGPIYWGVCHHHKLKWQIGSNVYSSWRDQTEDDSRMAATALAGYTDTAPEDDEPFPF